MHSTRLSSSAAIALFVALKDNNKLKRLNNVDNTITDDALNAITTAALQSNTCLVTLSLYNNALSSEAITNIVQSLEVNNTLQFLGLPNCPECIQKYNIIPPKEVINEKKVSKGCLVKLEIKFDYVS